MIPVFYDLETTGLNHATRHEGVQIVSIGATTVDGSKKFHEYLLPTCDIDPMASKVHGLTKSTDQTKMFLNSVELEDVVSIKDGLQHFVDFLKQVSEEGNILLIAHNNHKFDKVVLYKNLRNFSIKFPKTIKAGDSMDVMKTYRASGKLYGNLTLSNCMAQLLKRRQADVHDAEDDAADCKDIVVQATKNMGFENVYDFFAKQPKKLIKNMKA